MYAERVESAKARQRAEATANRHSPTHNLSLRSATVGIDWYLLSSHANSYSVEYRFDLLAASDA
jgi:hypothetical protein